MNVFNAIYLFIFHLKRHSFIIFYYFYFIIFAKKIQMIFSYLSLLTNDN